MTEKNISLNGRNLFYRIQGEGPVVMLVHGFGEDGNIWKHQFQALPGYKLIIPDVPGSGKSDMISDMSMEGLAGALYNITETENVTSLIIIGHSMGGYISLAFVERYREKVRAFGLFHSTAFADSPEKVETREKGIAFIEKNGAAAFIKTTTPNLYHPQNFENNYQLIEDHIASVSGLTKEALIAYYRAMIARPDRTSVLKDSYLPVLFIFGRKDNAVPIEDGLKQSHLPLVADVRILESSGHMGMIEETVNANTCLQSFLTYVTSIPS